MIRVEHGKPSTLISAAKRAGEARAAQRASEQAMAAATRLREKQMDMEYRTALAQQDRVIDLQMNERAKLWEIQKMELRSQIDFQREEKLRQRELDGYDNIDTQLDKEVQAGRMTEKEAEPYRLKNDLARQGMNVSISEITRQQEQIDLMEQLLQQYLAGGEPEDVVGGAPPIYAVNHTTGERRVSYDNGETWQPVGEAPEEKRIIRKPVETTPFTREFRGKF